MGAHGFTIIYILFLCEESRGSVPIVSAQCLRNTSCLYNFSFTAISNVLIICYTRSNLQRLCTLIGLNEGGQKIKAPIDLNIIPNSLLIIKYVHVHKVTERSRKHFSEVTQGIVWFQKISRPPPLRELEIPGGGGLEDQKIP